VSVKRLLAAVPILALAAGIASAAPAKQGGIFSVGTTGASTQVDPQLAYVTTSWWLEYATAAKLYNYPDKAGLAGGLLRPEVASGYTVSRDGKTYTFTVRKGFRFSDGTPVTARSFAYAFQRVLSPELASPAAQFIFRVQSAKAKGRRLVIRLKSPDAGLLGLLAMPFFQATSTKLPLNQEITGAYPSAGPYYFARNDVDSLTSLRRNPYWKGNRPRHLAGVDVHWNLNEQTAFQQTLANQLDEGPIPAADVQSVANRFGVNKTRFWAKPVNCAGFITFNNSRGLFAGNAPMRKAFNWAIDRKADAALAGAYAAKPWTQLLSPVTPGVVTDPKKQPYSPGPNLAKARKLAAGHFRDGKIKLWYRRSGNILPPSIELIRRALIGIGFMSENIQMVGFSGADIYTAIGVQGADWDLAGGLGWCSDYPGSSLSDLRILLYSAGGPPSPSLQARLDRAAKLSGDARARALAKLAVEIMKQVAPMAPMRTYNNRFLLSNRVDPHSLVYQPAIQDWSIPALALR
jgi:ABC-type transport system substrate-binding protein